MENKINKEDLLQEKERLLLRLAAIDVLLEEK